jgi:aspartate kinase
MELIVQKLGGAPLSDLVKIKSVAARINELEQSGRNIIIVSAMGKTTDKLIFQSQQLSEHPIQRELDVLLSTDEIISAALQLASQCFGKKRNQNYVYDHKFDECDHFY